MYNSIVVAGYLVADPELREVKNNSKVCKLRLCISEANSKAPCYIDAELWDKQAETAAKFLVKGRRIIAQGELSQSTWEKDGQKMSKYFIRANSFRFIGDGKDNKDGDASTPAKSSGKQSSTEDLEDDVPF
jgi:single-strand DNA-binding protein